MLKFAQNILKFKLTWKWRLQFFYFFARVHALAHFTYSGSKNKVRFSFISTVYGCVWTAGYFLFLIFILVSIIVVDSVDAYGGAVVYFVNGAEMVTIALRAFTIYLLQVVQSKELAQLINDAIGINQLINCQHRTFFNLHSLRFVKLYKFKERCVLLQFLLLAVHYCAFLEHRSTQLIQRIVGFLLLYTHFLTIAVSGLHFYGSLLFGYKFYDSLNRKSIQILNEVEANEKSETHMESYNQACDELDKISLAYTRVSAYVASVNRLFAVQISFELLDTFIMITCALFYIFYALLASQQKHAIDDGNLWGEPFYEIFNSAIFGLVYFIEVYTITCISDAVINEAEKLSTYIHRSIFVGADKRFIRCVQQLSLKVFFEKPQISPMNMFVINKSLIIGIAATIATYLFILIQFQLDRNQHSVVTP